MDSGYLFCDSSQRTVSRFVGSPVLSNKPLEMQSDYTSATAKLKEPLVSQGCLDELMIKGLARLTALAKPCSLSGRDSGFIGSRVERQRRASTAGIGIL